MRGAKDAMHVHGVRNAVGEVQLVSVQVHAVQPLRARQAHQLARGAVELKHHEPPPRPPPHLLVDVLPRLQPKHE